MNRFSQMSKFMLASILILVFSVLVLIYEIYSFKTIKDKKTYHENRLVSLHRKLEGLKEELRRTKDKRTNLERELALFEKKDKQLFNYTSPVELAHDTSKWILKSALDVKLFEVDEFEDKGCKFIRESLYLMGSEKSVFRFLDLIKSLPFEYEGIAVKRPDKTINFYIRLKLLEKK